MWAVRRAAISPLRISGYRMLACRNTFVPSDVSSNVVGKFSSNGEHGLFVVFNSIIQNKLFDHVSGLEFFLGGRFLSSQAGSDCDSNENNLEDGFSELEDVNKDENDGEGEVEGSDSNSNEDKLEDGFSELEDPDDVNKDGNDGEGEVAFASGSESFDDDDSGEGLMEAQIELLTNEVGAVDALKESPRSTASPLIPIILRSPPMSLKAAINKWVEEGNYVNDDVVLTVTANLRKRKLFRKALERDYAARVDLIAKVHGIHNAELHIKKIPADMQTEVIYRTLLANCVYFDNVKKAEHMFNSMMDKGFPLTAFSCNQLLLLYKRHDRKKIADVLLMMEDKNVKPTLFTYNILINAKGQAGDYEGMYQVIENMNSEGIVPNLYVQAMIAMYYLKGNFKDKALGILNEMEGGNEKSSRAACKDVLPLYASLGKSDDVDRLWILCQPNPQIEESLAVIVAWGKLGKIENAESAFEKAITKSGKLPQKVYVSLLKIYAENKLLAKGKELVKRMSDNGCFMGPLTWDAIVKLYVQSGEVEKAHSIFNKAMLQNAGRPKPLYSSYLSILEKYAQKGDVHNAEKIFEKAREGGYVGKLTLYQALLQAYINANRPAYGFRERLKADNVFPNRTLSAQLSKVDRLKNSVVAELLE